MKLKLFVLSTILLSMASLSAHATVAANAHVTTISQTRTGIVDVYLDVARTNLPACAGSNTTVFRFDATTTEGQALLASFLVAYTAGHLIDVTGSGTCDAGGGAVESISYISIRKQ
ncbi:hypothetical protein [Asticcacaulis sp. 201]|uniref:hypothetical protein n=1 Tax=Asticcacaulis sp. 201 TaxID=3028787 RepID=UPI002915D098|nr:hypothetical protein [Asticcacaulis sp. 201]MDV6331323.1 hypothetical protein [Asticcacaulis sp. 201]